MFDSREYQYSDTTVAILGKSLLGLRGLTWKRSQEKEVVTGRGNTGKAIQRGEKKYEGTLMVLKSDFDDMNKAARLSGYEDIVDVPGKYLVITCVFQKEEFVADTQTVMLENIEFTEYEDGLKTGDKFKEISLPFIFYKRPKYL